MELGTGGVPPFISKLFDILTQATDADCIKWGQKGDSIIVTDQSTRANPVPQEPQYAPSRWLATSHSFCLEPIPFSPSTACRVRRSRQPNLHVKFYHATSNTTTSAPSYDS